MGDPNGKVKWLCQQLHVVNYHRFGFPCTEALCVSSTHFRVLIVPQKGSSKKSPIFKPADTFPISWKYKQKEAFLSEEQTTVFSVICKSPQPQVHLLPRNSPLMTLYEECSPSRVWFHCPLLPTGSADVETPKSSLHGKDWDVLIWKLGSWCLLPPYTLYKYGFIPFCPSLENEDPSNTEPDGLFKITTPKSFTVLPRLL